MTPAQKEIVSHLLKGGYMLKWLSHSGEKCYRLYDPKGTPLRNCNERTVKKIDRFLEGSIYKKDSAGRITLNLSVVRKVDGRKNIKKQYKKLKKQKMNNNLTFGQAIEAVKEGKLIAREGWNGKGMFVFMRPEQKLALTVLLGTVATLPNGVKNHYELKYRPITAENNPVITFTAYLCMKAADDTIVNGWLASQTDMLANDWCILN